MSETEPLDEIDVGDNFERNYQEEIDGLVKIATAHTQSLEKINDSINILNQSIGGLFEIVKTLHEDQQKIVETLLEEVEVNEKKWVVVVTRIPDNKIHGIKGIRAITNLGLREAKDWVERPVPFDATEKVQRGVADEFAKHLDELNFSYRVEEVVPAINFTKELARL